MIIRLATTKICQSSTAFVLHKKYKHDTCMFLRMHDILVANKSLTIKHKNVIIVLIK